MTSIEIHLLLIVHGGSARIMSDREEQERALDQLVSKELISTTNKHCTTKFFCTDKGNKEVFRLLNPWPELPGGRPWSNLREP